MGKKGMFHALYDIPLSVYKDSYEYGWCGITTFFKETKKNKEGQQE